MKSQTKLQLTIILNNLEKRVSALKRHLQAEYKAVHTQQCHKWTYILWHCIIYTPLYSG
jgi:hypothetical protein